MKKHFKAKKVVRSGETTDLTEGIFESLNAGTKRIYQRQSHIDYETQQLNENAEEFGRQSILWMQMIQDMRSAIQEVTEIQRYGRVIEKDMANISNRLASIERNQEP
eukprot:TRINITY_DN3384_c0_g1_i2.p1 TRINITY_DN3384_c0_g1~~TRINITY_DN3384_c0_g1_i2.p1  ORF type:complete len:119 (-),score=21.13 TRINITY_DN3384_c0_g1_i2:101-421(-)